MTETTRPRLLRVRFPAPSSHDEVESDLLLAMLAAESLYGGPRLQLDARYLVADDGSSAVLEVQGPAGEAAAQIFLGFAGARVGETVLTVEWLDPTRDRSGS